MGGAGEVARREMERRGSSARAMLCISKSSVIDVVRILSKKYLRNSVTIVRLEQMSQSLTRKLNAEKKITKNYF